MALSAPRCGMHARFVLSTRKLWKCMGCKRQFSYKVGTIFEDSALTLNTWLPAFWMIVNAKNGISSCELARALGVTQKTAWFMLHRIRLAIQDGTLVKIRGQVGVDETFIGGRTGYGRAPMKIDPRRENLDSRQTSRVRWHW